MSDLPLVDLVVPTFNHAEMVERAAPVLRASEPATVTFVDDVSPDDTVDRLSRVDPPVDVVALDEHRGLAHAMNEGANQGAAKWILFLNDDVLPEEGAIERLVAAAETYPAAVFAGGVLVDPDDGEPQQSFLPRGIPGTLAMIVRLTGVERFWRSNPVTGGHIVQPLATDRVSVTDRQPAGACLLVRRDVFDAVGGWDERFWFWYEDVDLVRRLLDHGVGVFEPRARFTHLGRHSTRAWQRATQHGRLVPSSLAYAAKHLGVVGRISVGLTVVATSAVRVALHTLRRDEASVSTYRQLVARGAEAISSGATDLGRPIGLKPRTRTGLPAPAGTGSATERA